MAKLSTRLGGAEMSRINEHLALYKESIDSELQQRAVEFTALLGHEWSALRPVALEKMPLMDEVFMPRQFFLFPFLWFLLTIYLLFSSFIRCVFLIGDSKFI